MVHTERQNHDHDPERGRHGHAHGHDHHGHDHHGHDHHGHAHDPSTVVAPGPSLLRMSGFDRLIGAAFLSGLIWLGVKWAIA